MELALASAALPRPGPAYRIGHNGAWRCWLRRYLPDGSVLISSSRDAKATHRLPATDVFETQDACRAEFRRRQAAAAKAAP